MALYNAQVSLHTADGIQANYITNTYHFDIGFGPVDPLDVVLDAVSDQIEFLYLTIDAFMSSALSAAGHDITWYRMSDPEPRVPVLVRDLGPLSLGTTALAPEMAICLSSRAAYVSGVNNATKRNRVFLGPWGTSASVLDTTNGTVKTSLVDTIANAGDVLRLYSYLFTDGAAEWVAYSPTLDTYDTVVAVWCDNEWDHQSRRQKDATYRKTNP